MNDEWRNGSAEPIDPAEFSHLRRVAGAVVLFGGEVRRPKLARLRQLTGLPIEWVEGRDSARLAWRVRRGDVAAVVLLEGLVGHSEAENVVRALRRRGTPLGYGGRGGLGTVFEGLRGLDLKLSSAAAAPGS